MFTTSSFSATLKQISYPAQKSLVFAVEPALCRLCSASALGMRIFAPWGGRLTCTTDAGTCATSAVGIIPFKGKAEKDKYHMISLICGI